MASKFIFPAVALPMRWCRLLVMNCLRLVPRRNCCATRLLLLLMAGYWIAIAVCSPPPRVEAAVLRRSPLVLKFGEISWLMRLQRNRDPFFSWRFRVDSRCLRTEPLCYY